MTVRCDLCSVPMRTCNEGQTRVSLKKKAVESGEMSQALLETWSADPRTDASHQRRNGLTVGTYHDSTSPATADVRGISQGRQFVPRRPSTHGYSVAVASPRSSRYPPRPVSSGLGLAPEHLSLSVDPDIFALPGGNPATHEFQLDPSPAEELGTGYFHGWNNDSSQTAFAMQRQRNARGPLTLSWPWVETKHGDTALNDTLEMERAEISFKPTAAGILGAIYDLGHVSCEELAERIETPDEWIWFSRLQRARLVYDLGEAFTLSREGLAVVKRLLSEDEGS